MTDFDVLHQGARSDQARRLAIAINARFEHRLPGRRVKIWDGPMTLTPDLHAAAITCASLLGASSGTIAIMRREKIVPVGVNRMIRSPGTRTKAQLDLGRRRVAGLRAARKRREESERAAHAARRRVCEHAKQAAANYRKNPSAYHYLAGGTPNLIYLRPTPHSLRSDCSQFVAAVYKDCGLPSPGDVAHQWVNTWAMDRKGRVTTRPRPGDAAMYGPRGNPHHVELYIGEPGCEFIGHGSPPVDSQTPGRPSYYLTFDFLD